MRFPDRGHGGRRSAPLRVALSTPDLRRCQLAVATWRTVDMVVLVTVSAYVFPIWGAGAVAVFGVVRAAAPAVGVPLVLARTASSPTGRVLAGCAVVAASAALVVAGMMHVEAPLTVLLLTIAVGGVALCCFRPLLATLLPALITTPAELVATSAASGLVSGASSLTGAVLAGAGLATVGPAGVMVAAGVVLAVTATRVSTLRGIRADPGQGRQRLTVDVLSGFLLMAQSRPVAGIVAMAMGQTFVRGALNVLVVVLAIEVLDVGRAGVGMLLAAIGVGTLAGFPVAVRVARTGRLARALAVGLFLWGAPVVMVALASAPAAAICLFAMIGVGNTIVDIALYSLLQRLEPGGRLGRLLGSFETALYLGMALGAVVAERLLAGLGVRTALVVTGCLLPVAATLGWRWLARMDEQLDERNADVELLQLQGIFSPLVLSAVDHLAARMARHAYAVGEVIVAKGDHGDCYFLIEDGVVEIVDEGAHVALLGAGDGFGEMSLLRDMPRTATAIARTGVRARSLHREDFLSGMASEERARAAAERLVEDRLQAQEERRVGG